MKSRQVCLDSGQQGDALDSSVLLKSTSFDLGEHTREKHYGYLRIAMEEAEMAFNRRTYPVGAVIVSPDGEIISRGHNHVYHHGDFTSHAEVEAIRRAGSQLMREPNFGSCTLYTTLEPCLMCCGAILYARIARVIWIKDDDIGGAVRLLRKNTHVLNSFYRSKFNVLEFFPAEECALVRDMDNWMESWNNKKKEVLEEWGQPPMRESLI